MLSYERRVSHGPSSSSSSCALADPHCSARRRRFRPVDGTRRHDADGSDGPEGTTSGPTGHGRNAGKIVFRYETSPKNVFADDRLCRTAVRSLRTESAASPRFFFFFLFYLCYCRAVTDVCRRDPRALPKSPASRIRASRVTYHRPRGFGCTRRGYPFFGSIRVVSYNTILSCDIVVHRIQIVHTRRYIIHIHVIYHYHRAQRYPRTPHRLCT